MATWVAKWCLLMLSYLYPSLLKTKKQHDIVNLLVIWDLLSPFIVYRNNNKKLYKLTVLICSDNDRCTLISTSLGSRCKHCNAIVGVFIQTRQSSSSCWSIYITSLLRPITQFLEGNGVTQYDTIFISSWNLVPLNQNTGGVFVASTDIGWGSIWPC